MGPRDGRLERRGAAEVALVYSEDSLVVRCDSGEINVGSGGIKEDCGDYCQCF